MTGTGRRNRGGDVPDWLAFIITTDELHDWGLMETSTRPLPQRQTSWNDRWLQANQLFIEEIPQRELEDPPDSGIGSTNSGMIEELSITTIEESNLSS